MKIKGAKQNALVILGVLLLTVIISFAAQGFANNSQEDEYNSPYDFYTEEYQYNGGGGGCYYYECEGSINSSEIVDYSSTTPRYTRTTYTNDSENKDEIVETTMPEKVTQLEAANSAVVEIIEKNAFTHTNVAVRGYDPTYREILIQVRYTDGTVKQLHHLDTKKRITRLMHSETSRAGHYLHLEIGYYEGKSSHIYDLSTGEDILKGKAMYIDWKEDTHAIVWAPNDVFFAFKTYLCEQNCLDAGKNAVYVVKRSTPHAFATALVFDGYYAKDPDDIVTVTDISVYNNLVYFTGKDKRDNLIEFFYNVETGKLTSSPIN